MKTGLKRLTSIGALLTLVSSFVLGWHVFEAQSATYTWDNGGGDGLWSTCANWSTNTCPTSADIAQFDPATSDTSSTIDASFVGSVAGVNIMSGFTGTITQARTLTVGSSGFVQAGGTFTGASQTIDINGPLTLTAGTFTSTSGTLTLSGALTVGASNTFNHNSGTFTFDGAADRSANVDTTETFNNVTINLSAASDDLIIASGDTLVAVGTLTLTNGQINTGTLEAQGTTITKATTWDGGNGILLITQNTTRNITWTSGPSSGLTLNAPNTTITSNYSSVFTYEGNLTVTSGTITHAGSTSNVSFEGNFLVNGGTYVATPFLTSFTSSTTRTWGVTSGTFTHSSGTVWLNTSAGNLTVQGATTFYNVLVSSTSESYTIFFPAGQTQTIANHGWFLASNASFPENVRIPIESTSSGSQATINIQNDAAFASVSLKDINFTGEAVACSAQCNDRGNNSGIDFSGSNDVIVTPVLNDTTEAGGTTTFTVALYSRPQADVTIALTSTDVTEGTVSPSSLTFTSSTWQTPQTVTVTGVGDSTNDGNVAYTITVGAASSSDANYNGINANDVAVTNADDDTATSTLEYEDSADFTFEDVKDSTGTPITFYSHMYGGQGTLMTASGGAVVEIFGSKIREGCVVRIDNVDYNLVKVTEEAVYGYNVTLSRGNLTQTELEDVLIATTGTVNSIRCAEFSDGTLRLNNSYINYERISSYDGNWVTYDSANDQVWGTSFNGFDTVDVYSLNDQVVNSYTTGDFPKYPVYDSENDRVWVTNGTGDSVTVFDATTGGYAFGGTLGASTFTVGDNPLILEYDSQNDAVWVTHRGSSETTIKKLSTTDGSTVGTYTVGGRTYGITRDSSRNRIWVLTNCGTGGQCVVILNAATGAYINGTLANSTYAVPFTNVDTMIDYDVTNDVVWVLDEVPSSTKGFVYKINAETVAPVTSAFTGGGGLDLVYHAATDRLWVSNDNVGTWSAINAATGREIQEYQSVDCPVGITIDDDGDIWGPDCGNDTLDHLIVDAYPTAFYYATTTTDTNQIDISTVTSIDGIAITQTANSQSLYYAISFDDRRTFSVFAGSAQRHIASNKNSVTGGTEGVWYYRNNASTWFAAPVNSAESALSSAVHGADPEFTNNRMTSTTLQAMTSANWITLGFSAGVSTTLDVATLIYSDDPKVTPTLQEITFTLTEDAGGGGGGGGGGGPTPIYTADESITAPACSETSLVEVTLDGLRISDYMLSETPTFSGATWETFTPEDDDTSMTVPFTLSSGDGAKTIYAVFRSSTENQSGIKNTVVELDTTNNCDDVAPPAETPEEPTDSDSETPSEDGDTDSGTSTPSDSEFIGCEGLPMAPLSDEDRQRYRLGVSPSSGDYVPASSIYAGDFIRSENFDTVYCITEDRERRAFMDEITFFTQTRTFSPVKWVADETLAEFPLSFPMLPRENVSFLKFESDPRIYYFEQDPLDPAQGILYWVTTEELAAFIAGDNWSDYVIDLNPTLVDRFDYAAPFLTMDDVLAADIETSNFRARELLNEGAATQSDPGITSSLLEQTRDALQAAGKFLQKSLQNIKMRLSF